MRSLMVDIQNWLEVHDKTYFALCYVVGFAAYGLIGLITYLIGG